METEYEATVALMAVDHRVNECRLKIRFASRVFGDECEKIAAKKWSSKREMNLEIARRRGVMDKKIAALEQEIEEIRPEREAALEVVKETLEQEKKS